MTDTPAAQAMHFKAETRKLLDILAHSLYTEREIFLRELISNASDALTRLDFEMLTNHDVLDAESPLEIRLLPDPENRMLIIKDNGLGMTAEEMAENLGTIAHSGAAAFVQAAGDNRQNLGDVIGQFGVGFYSAFMVAEEIKVVSRSYRKDAAAAVWTSIGEDTFTIEPAEKNDRGTEIRIKLKEDAKEFAEIWRLRETIKKHSDFTGFPIYIGEEGEQINRQTALWRQNPRQVQEGEYHEFFKQLTLEMESPLTYAHMVVDAPVQMYAALFVPASSERALFSLRREPGLKLYSRKILIQNFCKELLPNYLSFVQGVVDSEDLPLNVSRENVQSNRVMAQLKKLVTAKVMDMLKALAKDKPEQYAAFWKGFGRMLKEGVATEAADVEGLYPLLRFPTTTRPGELVSLDAYVDAMKPSQKHIYYILGEDERSIQHSPHLDAFRKGGVEVLVLADPMDNFMLLRLNKYLDYELVNVAVANADLPPVEAGEEKTPAAEALPQETQTALIERIKAVLGERVTDVRPTDRLSDSPARLVDPDGSPDQSIQRVYRLLNKDFEVPKKVLEINPAHPIVVGLGNLAADDARGALLVEQLYEDALLIEGLHPDPAAMIGRIQQIMQAALK